MSSVKKKGKKSGEPKAEKPDSKKFENAAKEKGGQSRIPKEELISTLALLYEGDDDMLKKLYKLSLDLHRTGEAGKLNLTPLEIEVLNRGYKALTAIYDHVDEIKGREVHVNEKEVLKAVSEISFSTSKKHIREELELIAEKSPYKSVRELVKKKLELAGPKNSEVEKPT